MSDSDDAERDDIVRSVEDPLRESLFDGEAWTADYRRLRFAAVREPGDI